MEVSKNGMAQLATLLTLFVTVFAQDQVLLLPSQMQVAYAGGQTRLECISGFIQRPTATIEWFFNETLTISSLSNVTADLSRSESSDIIRGSVLEFSAVPVEYNMTRIHCRVEFTTGSPSTSTTTVLLVQDLLGTTYPMIHVSEDFMVLLNWTAPFTLLGASEITYCVDVVDLTTRRALLSECGTNITEFTYTAMPRDFACGDLSFTVTPVNVVGNGTSATVGLTNLSSNPLTPPELVNTEIMPSRLVFVMSAPVCNIELRFMDVDTGEITTLGDTDVNISGANIVLSSQQLGQSRNYNVSITASNFAGSTMRSLAHISTQSFARTTTKLLTTTVETTAKRTPENSAIVIESRKSSNYNVSRPGAAVGGTIGCLLIVVVVAIICFCVWHLRPNNKTGRASDSTERCVKDESVHYAVVDTSHKLKHAGVESVASTQEDHNGADKTEANNLNHLQSAFKEQRKSSKPDIKYMEVQPHTDSTTQIHEASCDDVQYSTIAGSSNNGQTYAIVASKSVTVDTSHEVSRAVNEVNYSTIQPHGFSHGTQQQGPDVYLKSAGRLTT